MASPRTQAQYERDARRLLARARTMFPGLPAAEALVQESALAHLLEEQTVRLYKQGYQTALNILVEGGECSGAASTEAIEKICRHLRERAVKDLDERTSALQVLATEEQFRQTFTGLKQLTEDRLSRVAFAAVLYTFAAPRLALRPIEWIGARLDGKVLVVKNAKRRPRQKPTRNISLKRFPDVVVEAIRWLIALAERGVAHYEHKDEFAFEYWRNSVAACLARKSKLASGTRLSLYSFRHIAIATWKKAGFSAAWIAEMAGHLLLTSADRHYAPASKGWGGGFALAEPASESDLSASRSADEPPAVPSDDIAHANPVEAELYTSTDQEMAEIGDVPAATASRASVAENVDLSTDHGEREPVESSAVVRSEMGLATKQGRRAAVSGNLKNPDVGEDDSEAKATLVPSGPGHAPSVNRAGVVSAFPTDTADTVPARPAPDPEEPSTEDLHNAILSLVDDGAGLIAGILPDAGAKPVSDPLAVKTPLDGGQLFDTYRRKQAPKFERLDESVERLRKASLPTAPGSPKRHR